MKRTMLIAAAGVVVVVMALLASAPTLVSWGLFRGTIISAVSGAVNGTVTINELSVGWFSGVRVRGFTIDDPAAGNRVSADVSAEQGVWKLLTAGIRGLDVHVSGSVKTRRAADGTLGITKLMRSDTSVAPAASTPKSEGAKSTSILPAGLDVVVTIDGIAVEILEESGATYAAVRDFKGSARVVTGGDTQVKFTARTEVQGTTGAVDVEISAPGLFDAAGALHLQGTAVTATVKASDAALNAAGLSIRINELSVALKSADMTGAINADVTMRVALDGQPESALSSTLRFDRLLSASAEPIFDLSAIHGTVRAEAIPTAPFERFVAGSGAVLARDVGKRVDFSATFADATGGAISIELRSDVVTARAEGSIDPATRAATLRTVEADATLAPALLAALGDIVVTAPARMSLRAKDVAVPAAAADGSFPEAQVRFDAIVTLALTGLQVPGPDGRVALDISELRATAKAAPLASGLVVDLSAVSTGAAAQVPLRATASIQRGGAFGINGTVRVVALPTALIRPFLPKDLPIDLTQDVGPAITSLDATIAAGDEPAITVALESAKVAVAMQGVVHADRSIHLSKGATVTMRAIRPALVALSGVTVAAPIDAAITINALALPAPKSLTISGIGVDATIAASKAGGGAINATIGSGDGARVLAVESLRASVKSEAIGSAVQATVDTKVDGMVVKVSADARGLKSFAAKDIESAALLVDAQVSGITSERLAKEVPSAAKMIRELSAGNMDASFHYEGSTLDGKGRVAVKAAGVELRANAALSQQALTVDAIVSADVSPALLAAAAELPVKLAAPAHVDIKLDSVTMKRTVPWEFAAPAAAHAELRIPAVVIAGVPGLSADVGLTDTVLDTNVTLGAKMAARGTLTAKIAAHSGNKRAPLAPLSAHFAWADAGAAPASWTADADLDGIKVDGLAMLIDIDEAMRKEIGDGARLSLKGASIGAGGVSFEVESTLQRLKANLNGQLVDGVLSLANSAVDVTIPASSATEMLNALSSKPVEDAPDAPNAKKEPPAWKQVSAVALVATITNFRMRLGGDAVTPVVASAPAPGSGVPVASAAAPRVVLPAGFAAVVKLDMKPVMLVPTNGEPLTIESVAIAINAPGLEKPAVVKIVAAIAGSGGQRVPIALDATLTDWAGADGAVLIDRIRVDGTLKAARASTRVVGAVLGMGAELEEAVGPELSVDASVVSSGPGSATGAATVSSKFVTMKAPQVSLKNGVVNVVPAQPVTIDFIPSEPLRHRYLASINPVFRDVRLADEKKPIVFTVQSFSYPIDGNHARMSGDMRLVVGDVLLDPNADNDVLNLLKVFQTKDNKPIDGVIDPLNVVIRDGQLTYKDFEIGIEKQGKSWKTRLIFDGDIDLTKTPPFARSIAANYPLGSVAREVVGVLPNDDGGGSVANLINTASLGLGDALQLRIKMRGPLGEVNGKPAKLERKVKVIFDAKSMGGGVGNTVEGIGQKIGDLFGGNKNPKKGNKK
jgi:hypothetical protein